MGKFDGILLASDLDGTLSDNGVIPEINLSAIKYFQENGGKFTVCTGRYYQYMKNYESQLNINTYTICLNGAYIIDTHSGKMLYEAFCDEYLFVILKKLFSLPHHYKTIALYDNINPKPLDFTVDEFLSHIDELKSKKLYKVLLKSDTPKHAEEGVKMANELDLRDYIAVRSWEISLEIQPIGNSKGAAIRRLADELGSRLVIAVGDYENDITMLREADVGYAVSDANPALLPFADKVTVSVREGAIAAVIQDIADNYCK